MFDHIQAFYQPTSVREAVRLLHDGKGRGRVVAGGTDLTLLRDRSIRFLVGVTHLGLDYIRRDPNGCDIGAACTMAALEHSPVVRGIAGGILARAAATCGSIQIRNVATVGGNLANGSPAADTATPLLAMDAAVVLQTDKSRRRMTLREFFALPQRRRINGGLLVQIFVPKCKGRAGWSFQKFGRTETDIAIVNAAAGLGIAKDGTCAWARIALGAVAPAPMRAEKAEALLAGQTITADLIERAAESVAREVQPITDQRAPAEYRRELSQVLARRALRECAQQAGCAL
ncbi:MAG: FAD binding domain-containing protein [Acidobacteriia bacterium]|nr:FAD binding domain-containing protein [Terriglobia bacterium]